MNGTDSSILNRFKILSGSTIKIIACVTMLIDHIGAFFMNKYLSYCVSIIPYEKFQFYYNLTNVMRSIGRIAFPIFSYLLVQGFLHTKNVYKYALRLLLFAVISDPFFDLAFSGDVFYPAYQNTFFTLFFSLLTIWGIKTISEKISNSILRTLLIILDITFFCFIAYVCHTDYSYSGILVVTIFYVFASMKPLNIILGMFPLYYEPFAFFSVIPLLMYNGKRGLKAKYFFYAFYPLHLFLIYLISVYAIPA